MSPEFRLPDGIAEVGAEGIVVTWFKGEGQAVRAGELLLEVQFEKVSSEVHAPADGVLQRIRIPQGGSVRPGDVLCELAAGATAPVAREVVASPAARRLARELGVDLTGLAGSGPEARITEADVRAAATAAAPASAASPTAAPAPAGRREPLSPAQRTVAERMARSLQSTAQLTLGREADVTALLAARERLKAAGSAATLTDLIHRAVVLALAEHPRLQAQWEDGGLFHPDGVNLGFAVARGDDLLAPVIHAAQGLGLEALAQERRRLSEAAAAGQLTPRELEGGTFTVTSLGPQGIDFFTPVLNPPQAAILGVGRVVRRPGLQGEAVVPRAYLTLSLTFDHRVVNGDPAARFLAAVASRLEAPDAWLDAH